MNFKSQNTVPIYAAWVIGVTCFVVAALGYWYSFYMETPQFRVITNGYGDYRVQEKDLFGYFTTVDTTNEDVAIGVYNMARNKYLLDHYKMNWTTITNSGGL